MSDTIEFPVSIKEDRTADLKQAIVAIHELSERFRDQRVAEFIAKPFLGKERSIAKVIRSVLKHRSSPADSATATDSHQLPIPESVDNSPSVEPDASVASLCGPRAEKSEPQPFAGGEIVFHPDRVTLSDVAILVNSRVKQMRKILGALRHRTSAGNYIARGGPGYRLHEWITVRDAEPETTEQDTIPTIEQPTRRDQILEILRRGQKLRSTNIAVELGCSVKTAKRELDALRIDGLVEFVGPTKTGTYQLRE